jgi:sorbitol-specific phosphotransferase system component IIBC
LPLAKSPGVLPGRQNGGVAIEVDVAAEDVFAINDRVRAAALAPVRPALLGGARRQVTRAGAPGVCSVLTTTARHYAGTSVNAIVRARAAVK